MTQPTTIILGAGLSGLATAYHLGHERCLLLEQKERAFGHISSVQREGFTWDEGPHVSFTKHAYVRELFAASVDGDFQEFDSRVSNYYRGHWIDHPAQVSLHQVPEPLRAACLQSFLESRRESAPATPPANYQEWLERAFGPVFANAFPAAYTRKYWACEPHNLGTAWIGDRILYPKVEDVMAGAKGGLGRNAHYITSVRYPSRGGFQQFARNLKNGANILYGVNISAVDLQAGKVHLVDGSSYSYEKLINTLPLPSFLRLLPGLPAKIEEARRALSCSELLLVNVTAKHPVKRPETWFYVYDEDKLSTRVNFTEHLSPLNAPAASTGVQVEVYASRHRPFRLTRQEIEIRVQWELADMGLVEPESVTSCHSVEVPWANVIFDHEAKPALEVIWSWLERFGLEREMEDTLPLTNWARPSEVAGRLAFAGRYAQWKYYWTDDCVLRGRQLGVA